MKNSEPSGVESIIIWNSALILSFILIISLGSLTHFFTPALSSLSEAFPAKVH